MILLKMNKGSMSKVVKAARRAEVASLLKLVGIDLNDDQPTPKRVWSREGKEMGTVITPNARICGCGGTRVSVRWPDGKITYPCRDGMCLRRDGDWQIV